jgi:hypothetical protein
MCKQSERNSAEKLSEIPARRHPPEAEKKLPRCIKMRLNFMKVQTSVILPENLLSAVEQLSEKNTTLSDFIEAALQFYIAKLKQSGRTDNDIEIINENAEYLNRETRDALQYQAEL